MATIIRVQGTLPSDHPIVKLGPVDPANLLGRWDPGNYTASGVATLENSVSSYLGNLVQDADAAKPVETTLKGLPALEFPVSSKDFLYANSTLYESFTVAVAFRYDSLVDQGFLMSSAPPSNGATLWNDTDQGSDLNSWFFWSRARSDGALQLHHKTDADANLITSGGIVAEGVATFAFFVFDLGANTYGQLRIMDSSGTTLGQLDVPQPTWGIAPGESTNMPLRMGTLEETSPQGAVIGESFYLNKALSPTDDETQQLVDYFNSKYGLG